MKAGVVIERVFPKARAISIRQFKKSCINEIYDVKLKNPSRDIIIRIFNKEGWKAIKDQFLYDLIKKKTDVPVPTVLFTGKNYSVLSKVQGTHLKKDNKALIKKAGELLAKLHTIKFNSYGWIVGNDISPKFNSWDKFMLYDLNHKLSKLKGNIDNQIIKKSRNYFDENCDLLKIKSRPCLLHKDYHYSHIIVNKNKINGIIDIEWATAGHSELDLAKSILWMFEKDKKRESIFLEGYRKYGSISKDFEKRKVLYSMLLEISSLSFSYELSNYKWCNYNLNRIKRFLKNG